MPCKQRLAFVKRVRDKTVLHVLDLASGKVSPVWDGLSHDMQEAWAMFKGKKGLSGRTYTAPSAACKNYVIFIGNSFSSSGSPGEGGSTGILT